MMRPMIYHHQLIALVLLLLSHVTWTRETCEREAIDSIVCGNQPVKLYRCRGVCESTSNILMAYPWYRTDCRCCRRTETVEELRQCDDGSQERIVKITRCNCESCNAV